MPLPGNVNTITLTGNYTDLSGTPSSGTLHFRPSVDILRNPDANMMIPDYEFVVELDGNGDFSIELPATDDPDLLPNPWHYRVSERLIGHTRDWFMELPLSLAPTVDISDIEQAISAPRVVTYVPRFDFDQHVADTLGVHGIANTADLETKVGATTKVNAHSGVGRPSLGSVGPHGLPWAAWQDSSGSWIYAKDHGVKADGVTNDAAAINAATLAAKTLGASTVVLPRGDIRTTSALAMRSGVNVRGMSHAAGGTRILNSASNVFEATEMVYDVAYSDFTINGSGGHLFATDENGVARSTFERLTLVQSNTGKSIWTNKLTATGGTFQNNAVRDCTMYGDPALGHTVPLWSIVSDGSLGNQNVFENLVVFYAGNYAFWLEETGANWLYDNTFRNICFEVCNGGNIKILSGNSFVIDNCGTYDLQAIGSTTRDLYYVGKSTGNSSRYISFRKTNRRGGTLGGGLVDIKLQTSAVAIVDFEHVGTGGGGLSIDVGLSSSVTFRGCSTSTTVTNPATNVGYTSGDTVSDTVIAGVLFDGAGTGSPEGVITAPVGSRYRRTDGDVGTTAYFKESGTGNTGWVAVSQRTDRTGQPLTSGEVTNSRYLFFASSAVASGQVMLTYFTATKSETINNLAVHTAGTAGAAATLIRFGVYSVASNGDLTLIASTANDTSLLAVTHTKYTKALSAPWSKVIGTTYALAVLFVGTTPPAYYGPGQGAAAVADAMYGLGPRLSGALAGQTDLPASITAGTIADTRRHPTVVMTP